LRQYESIFIINPELDESGTNTVIEGAKTFIESNGGKIIKVDLWGRKKLAYTVKQHNDGYFVLVVFESPSDFVRRLSTYYQIAEPIMKYMIVKFEADAPGPLPNLAARSHKREDDERSPGHRSTDRYEEDDDDF
jgi:small subunit ribosomal protein S6